MFRRAGVGAIVRNARAVEDFFQTDRDLRADPSVRREDSEHVGVSAELKSGFVHDSLVGWMIEGGDVRLFLRPRFPRTLCMQYSTPGKNVRQTLHAMAGIHRGDMCLKLLSMKI